MFDETEFIEYAGRVISLDAFLRAAQRSYDTMVLTSRKLSNGCLRPTRLPRPVKGLNIPAQEIAVILRARGPWDMTKFRMGCETSDCCCVAHVDLQNPEGEWIQPWALDTLAHHAAARLASLLSAYKRSPEMEVEGRIGRFMVLSPLEVADATWVLKHLEGYYANPNG